MKWITLNYIILFFVYFVICSMLILNISEYSIISIEKANLTDSSNKFFSPDPSVYLGKTTEHP